MVWRDTLGKFGGDKASPAKYSVQKEGGLHVVTADLGEDLEYVWYIDPDRGHNPTRIISRRKSRPNEPLAVAKCTLRKFEGVWFPDEVMYFDWKQNLRKTIRVESAEFDKPDHPSPLTPAAIGVESGTTVMKQGYWLDKKKDPGDASGFAWTGERIIPLREYNAGMKSGKFRPGPTVSAELGRIRREQEKRRRASVTGNSARLQPAAAIVGPNAWERYVDDVARVCNFSDTQKSSAQGILKELQARAVGTSAHHHPVLFEELKRRIDGILTPAQRQVLNSLTPASRPVQPPRG